MPTEITGYRNITSRSIEKATGNEDSVFSDTKMNMKRTKDKKPRPIIRSHKEKPSVKEVILPMHRKCIERHSIQKLKFARMGWLDLRAQSRLHSMTKNFMTFCDLEI